MTKSEYYERQLTGENYIRAMNYLKKNAVKCKRTAEDDSFKFVNQGEIVIDTNLRLRGTAISKEIREGIEKIICVNMPLWGGAIGVL